MGDVLCYVAAVVVVVAAIVKYRSIRPARPTPAQRHQLIMLVSLAPATVLSMPRTQATTAALDPVPFATAFVAHALGLIAGSSLVMMLAHVLDDPVSAALRARWRAATGVLLVTILVMATLLAGSGVQADGQFIVVAARHPALVIYHLVFVAFAGLCTSMLIALLRQFLSRPIDPLMRWGMRTVVMGAGLGLLFVAWTVFVMIDSNAGGLVTDYAWTLSEVLGGICVLCMAVGSTLSLIAGWLPSRISRARVRRALHELTPLWRRLVATLPEVAFHQADLVKPEDVLYRRVIEILDARVKLTEFIPPAVEAAVLAGIGVQHDTDTRLAVRAEAVLLAVAIDAYQAGCPPTESSVINNPGPATPDVLAEARRLIAVHTAMRDDLVVATLTRAVRAGLTERCERGARIRTVQTPSTADRGARRPWTRLLGWQQLVAGGSPGVTWAWRIRNRGQ